ncbi:glutamate-1-semialdehyde 2,1-aminomutase [Meiothermus taiwanensis]|jgi:glutamate-1-semialdehyde 2,1-aminomutase|uniref:Glutamate-1-semialdehyde 2,1-aminomutase n=3 Tax=Meiothermus taiwanensis TaxID=172827 RepID=A0ABM6WI63_9DEIN|nr:glutamate-1-semialdehyde 2,1-aminomutase [Meiothermus taiwanensis]AWR86819.1 glutamate-1-semialdehyde-2,1-aminomutase [Meiothermus taiwanensis WR-220]KIQ54160.1 glutamate-1-semialdehyde aminotransferase [Meiothermus taiwanensis]KZK15405.1 glutamate-1-semialdehyde aminotransferase [Meiothermus taiwanensis]
MRHSITRSEELFKEAQQVIPGGVNSPVRAFKAVGGTPRFIARAQGAYLWDADGNQLLDYIGSWGPMILGHNHPAVVAAIQQALSEGLSYGAPTEREIRLAQRVREAYPSADLVRFVSSGTEATMSALRLARGYTGRDRIVKFRGNYHGHADSLLVQAGSGLLTGGTPSSAGVPQAFAELTLVADYNEPQALEDLFQRYGEEIAAVIFEPVVGNAGVLIPTPTFLEALHHLTRRYGALLIADEVMTGFRLAKGGAVELFGLKPDLICWGKILGGGLPVGAYGGRAEIMQQVAPLGPVYQAGTLSGNPLSMAAGLATLETLFQDPPYERLEAYGAALEQGLQTLFAEAGLPVAINRVGSMITVFFREGPVQTYTEAVASDTERFKAFFHGLLQRGVYWPPSQFEAAFFSTAHGPEELDKTLEAVAQALKEPAAFAG